MTRRFRCRMLVVATILLVVAPTISSRPDDASRTARELLPPLPVRSITTDWLIDPSPYRAGVFRTDHAAEIALDNGLIRRTFRLAPNAATVGFDHLVTGAALLRGVKPEAIVELDGVRYEIGGLKGQPNYAYLLPEWVDHLRADERAFRFVGFHVGKPLERVQWKRVRHHAPGVRWPPAGVRLRMDYEMPDPTAGPGGAALPSDLGRVRLLADDFHELDKAWKIHTTDAHARSSFENEGKAGAIYTPTNTAVFAERPLPRGARHLKATIDFGTDRSSSWGPGLALVFDRGRVVEFHVRPRGDKAPFGRWGGRREQWNLGRQIELDLATPWTLRLRLEAATIACDARPATPGGAWRTVASAGRTAALGEPRALRVGKLDVQGGAADYGGDKGELVRSRVLAVAAWSAFDAKKVAATTDKKEPAAPVRVSVHYELYDGIPVLSKWITVDNPTPRPVRLQRFTSEVLAVVEHASYVEDRGVPFPRPILHVETDYSFGGMTSHNASRKSVHWEADPDYATQVNYLRRSPCQLEVRPKLGPDQLIAPGGSFESFRAFLLPYDSTARERKSLSVRRMYRTIAPWVTENPLMMHVRWSDPKTVRRAIDQCAEVGFEMVILTFGSGFNIENDSAEYRAKMKAYADYAREHGVEIGGYSLLASRRVGGGNDVVMPDGKRPTFGNSPCLESAWGQAYFRKLYSFYETTGFRLLEHDGSYPGDECTSGDHPGHRGFEDSRWNQWVAIRDFYRFCRSRGVYLNVPDFYYLAGSNKCGMGYRETNWSLPRAQQVIHTRQNIYDGTWTKTPSMGWMFVPLTQYHGGGAAATIEPLDEHRDHYERMLYSNLALGVQACYRGPRLFDTDRTKDLVARWVKWFKRYRTILESDVIHGRRADGRDLDWMLHVNPRLTQKGLLVVFNPLERAVEKRIPIDLYYTGLTDTARVRAGEGPPVEYRLDRRYRATLPVAVPAQGMAWYVIE